MSGELPRGWTWASLQDVCEVTLGQSPPGSSYNDHGSGEPFFQGKAEFGHLFPKVRKWTTEAKKRAAAGSVLISVRAPVGPTNIAPMDCAIGRGLASLRPSGGISTEFLLWSMRKSAPELARDATGSTFDAITGRQLRSHRIPVPPLAEQKRIVGAIEEHLSHLDAAESSLAAAKSKILGLKAVLGKTAVRHWPMVQLGDIADVFVGSTPSRTRPELWGGPVPWVSSGEIQFCRIRRTRESIATTAVRPDRIHPPGTVLLGMIGEGRTRGQAAVLEVAAAHNQNSAAIRTQPSILEPDWLFYVLSAQYESNRRIGSGNNQPALNKARVQALRIPVPPLNEQRRLVEQLDEATVALGELHSGLGGAEQRCAVLRRAVLSEAFSGQLVPQNPDDEPASVLLARVAASRPSKTEGRRVRA